MSRRGLADRLSLALRGALAVGGLVALAATPARATDLELAQHARDAIVDLDVAAARKLLEGADGSDPALAIEQARLALYEGDYDASVAILTRPDIARTAQGADLADIAQACARATAATTSLRDDEAGVVVRLQDEDDRAFAPLLVEVASAVRETLAKDLGVELPRPLHIELVRDLFTLAAMTGLPEQAAQTTGTVAVAKWGRVTMISPRAVPLGYPWADTLAHEMAHLAQTRASHDRAPLWLQEGVAKREETRWRTPRTLDHVPSPDAVAAIGFEKNLGRPIDKLGASIAMLPSADHAMVAFAEVTSFVDYWVKMSGDHALPALLTRLRTTKGSDGVDEAIRDVSGASLPEWNAQWMGHLQTVKRDLPPELAPGGRLPHEGELHHSVALGQLLARRAHATAAAKVFAKAQEQAPHDPMLRADLARALIASGRGAEAERLVSKVEDVHTEFGPWFTLNGWHLRSAGDEAGAEGSFSLGIKLDPFDDQVACEAKTPPDLPGSGLRDALCKAARAMPRD